MAASAEEFYELLNNEEHTDLHLLRRFSFYGIPLEVRSAMWKMLIYSLTDLSNNKNPNDSDYEYEGDTKDVVPLHDNVEGTGNQVLGKINVEGEVTASMGHVGTGNGRRRTAGTGGGNMGMNRAARYNSAGGENLYKGGLGLGENVRGNVRMYRAASDNVEAIETKPTSPRAGLSGIVDNSRRSIVTAFNKSPSGVSRSSAEHDGGFKVIHQDPEDVAPSAVYKSLRHEVEKYCNRFPTVMTHKLKDRMSSILLKCVKMPEFMPFPLKNDNGTVCILANLVYTFKNNSEKSTRKCFKNLLIGMIRHKFIEDHAFILAQFLMLFRSTAPKLFVHFEEEEVDSERWASSWIQYLLSRELPLECCIRLWDSYFSAPNAFGFTMHVFVCLAILKISEQDLMELRKEELLEFLSHLPNFDVDQLTSKAQYLYHSVNLEDL